MDLCRLCYLGTSLQSCKNLFGNEADNPPLLEIITKLTDLKIYENDPYSKIICTICYNSLLSFYKFRQNVLQTDSKFRHEFRNNKNNNHNSNNNAGIIELLQIKTEEDLDDLDDMKVNINETIQQYSTIFTDDGIKEDENSEEPKMNVINSLSIMGTNNKSPTKEELPQTNCKSSSSPDIRFQCKICEKTFTRKSTLKFHQRLHTNEKPYECNFCNRKYLLKSSFTQHLIAHTSLYKCEICGKKCAQRSHLIDHLKFHTGEKSHKCNVCEKGFALKSTLKDHMRLHTGEKPYQCDVCNKQFSQNAHLYVHTKVHTGEKPYECTICKKKFARKGHLNRHVKTHAIT